MHDWKSCVPVRVPRVQIPLSPKNILQTQKNEGFEPERDSIKAKAKALIVKAAQGRAGSAEAGWKE